MAAEFIIDMNVVIRKQTFEVSILFLGYVSLDQLTVRPTDR